MPGVFGPTGAIRTEGRTMSKKNDPQQSLARPRRRPAGAPEWVSPELIEQTLRIWQPYYDNQLVAEDALEIILNVGRLVGALSGGDDMKQ